VCVYCGFILCVCVCVCVCVRVCACVRVCVFQIWLSELSAEMKQTLKQLLVECVAAGRKGEVDPARYPSQVGLHNTPGCTQLRMSAPLFIYLFLLLPCFCRSCASLLLQGQHRQKFPCSNPNVMEASLSKTLNPSQFINDVYL